MAALDMKFNEVTKSVVRTRHMFASMGIFASNATGSRVCPRTSRTRCSRPGGRRASG